MVREVREVSLDTFNSESQNRTVFLWGAGMRLERILRYLACSINGVVDSDPQKWGKRIIIQNKESSIISPMSFSNLVKKSDKEIVILITSLFYSKDIINTIKKIECKRDMFCYIWNSIVDQYSDIEFTYTQGPCRIPKIIHYCWFGGGELPELQRQCIDSWKTLCKDYEIKRWDENSYDVKKNQYMRQAYEKKQWGFVPDYARLDILYNEGGIYLDTDVKLLSSLDPFLADEMFCSFSGEIYIQLGTGFGAVKGHWLIKELRDFYEGKNFINPDGTINRKPCTFYQEPVFLKQGFEMRNSFQKKKGVTIYPAGVFVSENLTSEQRISDKTVAVHYGVGTWMTEEEKKGLKH